MAKLNCEYAIGTYEINLLTKDEFDYTLNKLGEVATYIDTAVNYNNDYLFSDIKDFKLISKIAPCQANYYETLINGHFNCLKRDYIDIMLIHNSRAPWVDLAKRMEADSRFKAVGVSNFNVEELELYKKEIGHYPEYQEIEINPRYTDVETIEFCKKNGIKVIAYCILGGKYNAMRYVSVYSLQYLMAYAAHYADIIILRADSHRQANEFVDIAKNYEVEDLQYLPEDQDKSMVPMIYTANTIGRKYRQERSYFTAVGDGESNPFSSKVEIEKVWPDFEMLGDYAAYIRYLYKSDYTTSCVYDKDFLNIDDKTYLGLYLIDSNDHLTKVNIDATKHLYKYEA